MKLYSRKTPQDLDCGVTVFMKVFGAKWKPCIVDAISKGHTRPSEIHRHLKPATPRVVDMQLSELEKFSVVSKQVQQGFPLRVDYSLTDMGRGLLPVIGLMDRWGVANGAAVRKVSTQLHTAEYDDA